MNHNYLFILLLWYPAMASVTLGELQARPYLLSLEWHRRAAR